jgi:hypothetical protein
MSLPPAAHRGFPKQSLKPNTWYYGVRCDCGQPIVLHQDTSNGYGNEFLDLTKPIPVQCECGAVSNAQRFQKFKTPPGFGPALEPA